MSVMRAKLQVGSVVKYPPAAGETTQESVLFYAVGANQYPDDGSDENNTYSKWTPYAKFEIHITNPALFGKFKGGDCYYADFTEAPK